ncbi:MAG: hypothetical protein GY847_38350, partial [Proteobacteria bacterium]|nr:hypothetical protein [Pseudomonadota bacterium]
MTIEPSTFSNLSDVSIKKTKMLFVVVAALCLVGVGISIELTRIHIFTHTDPTYHSICAVSELVNCETVALSPYSVFAGLPVSVWGILGYLTIGLLATWSAFKPRLLPTWVYGALVSLSVGSLVVSIFL